MQGQRLAGGRDEGGGGQWFGCVDSLLDKSVMAQFTPNGIYVNMIASITFAETYVE